MVFEQKPLGPGDIDNQTIITPQEIKLRTAALDTLSKYTVNLAALAQGKPGKAIGEDTKNTQHEFARPSERCRRPGLTQTRVRPLSIQNSPGLQAPRPPRLEPFAVDRRT